jgi:CubicO group peptidase (beta-lactamase class C family)
MNFLVFSLLAVGAAFPSGLEQRLQAISKEKAAKYNCSISVAVRSSDDLVMVADGVVDFRTFAQATVADKYAWGSCTKMHTAASIMKLVSQGAFTLDHTIGSLVDDVLEKMKKADLSQRFSSVEDLWGSNITNVTIRQLLSMKDGVPDFDTAQPSRGGIMEDPLRAQLYKIPDHLDSPTELMSEPWVAHHWNQCSQVGPMSGFCYSSTNFVLLGLVLAQHANIADWKDLDQKATLPEYLQKEMVFAKDGTPVSYGSARGYDRTSYNMPNGTHNDHDNGDVKGVFAGWTASNVVASAAAMANMTWEIYRAYSLAPKEFIDQMIPPQPTVLHPFSIYGLGTFNVGFQTGQKGKYGEGYGHLGATYGYQSVSGYFPALDISLAIATNIETDDQVQPSDTMCFVYNAIAASVLDQNITCTFEPHGYYGGACKCDEIKTPSPDIEAQTSAVAEVLI